MKKRISEKLNKKLKYVTWKTLLFIDNKINHTIIDSFFSIFVKNDFMYMIWNNVFGKYCFWVNVTLRDQWNDVIEENLKDTMLYVK